MKKIALLSLIAYLVVLCTAFSPLALAEDEEEITPISTADEITTEAKGLEMNPTCNFQVTGTPYQPAAKNDTQAADDKLKADTTELETSIASDSKGCGEINSTTHSYEKSDCTSVGMVITEISEPIGGETGVNDASGEETNIIKNVYKGVCCFIPERNEEGTLIGCKETRNIYTDSYSSCEAAPAAHCEKRQWIIGTSGAGIIKVYVKQIYGWAAGIIGFIAVAVIVVSGIQITMSGVSGDITSAKDRIIQSISALVLLFLSGLILYTINPTFFGPG